MLNAAEIKKLAKEKNKRIGKDFLAAFDAYTRKKFDECLAYHNGGKVTLDAGVIGYIGGVTK